MHVSWSEIDTARQCLAKHHYVYKDRTQERNESPALSKGTHWHTMLEFVYNGHPEEAVAYAKRLVDAGDEHGELMVWMLHGYFEVYGYGDPIWAKATRMVEQRFEAELPDIGYGPLTLVGEIDLVVEIMGRLWIVDHKSGKDKPKYGSLEMADQWTLYTWLLRQNGYEVFGSVHNYAKTTKLKRDMTLDERFSRTPIDRSDYEIDEVVKEVTLQAWQAKLDNGAPRSPGDHCNYRCSYLDVCIAARRFGPKHEHEVLYGIHKTKEARK